MNMSVNPFKLAIIYMDLSKFKHFQQKIGIKNIYRPRKYNFIPLKDTVSAHK